MNNSVGSGKNRNIRDRNRRYINEIKESNPCSDCGKYYVYDVMEFDHIRGIKLFNINRAATNTSSIKRIKEEINKCDLVCSNCHRLRTRERRINNAGR